MQQDWTLVELQDWLDGLDNKGELTLDVSEMARLFGLNGAAVGRIANFARGHGCIAIYGNAGVTFRKGH